MTEFMDGSDFNPTACTVYCSSHASSLVVSNAHMGNQGTFDMLFNMVFFNFPKNSFILFISIMT